MGWKFDKKPDGERWIAGNPPSAEVIYVSDGEDNQAFVEFQAKQPGVIPHTLVTNTGTLFRQQLETRRMGFKHYEIVALYGAKPLEDWSWQGTTAGGTVKVKVGKHIQTYKVTTGTTESASGGVPANTHGTASAPDSGDENLYEGLINYNPETKEAEGIEIVIGGIVHFDFIQPVAAGAGTIAKFLLDAELVGKLSRTVHFGGLIKVGELLYLGGDYQDGRYVATSVVHHFAYAKNLDSALIEGIAGVTKLGWDVAWVEFQRFAKNSRPAGKPVRVHVEQVYEYHSQFSGYLGVPT